MSGGSFDYLSAMAGDISEVANRQYQLNRMLEAFEQHFPGSKVAVDMRSFVERLQQLERDSATFNDAWHAMEWWQSGDWGIESVQKAVDDYAGESEKFSAFMDWVRSGPQQIVVTEEVLAPPRPDLMTLVHKQWMRQVAEKEAKELAQLQRQGEHHQWLRQAIQLGIENGQKGWAMSLVGGLPEHERAEWVDRILAATPGTDPT